MLSIIPNNRFHFKLPTFQYSNCWIAGGCLRSSLLNETPNDIDIFGPDENSIQNFIDLNLNNAKLIHKSKVLESYILNGLKIQVVKRKYYNSIEECLTGFDYTICQFAFDGVTYFSTPEAVIDTYAHKLVINKLDKDFVIDSLRRMTKYIKYGFTICDGGLKNIVESIRSLKDEEVKNQIEFYPNGGPRINRFD